MPGRSYSVALRRSAANSTRLPQGSESIIGEPSYHVLPALRARIRTGSIRVRFAGMQRIRVLQVGDLHYDDAIAGPPDVDVKDPGFQPSLLAAAAPPQLRAVMQRLQTLCEADVPDAAVFCGDLSSRGNLDVYRECVAYLDDNLQLSSAHFWPPEQIHVVAGNHDVDRNLVDPKGVDLFQKFRPLEATWKASGTDVLVCDDVRSTSFGHPGSEMVALSLNSCVGCGEKRYRTTKMTDAKRATLTAKAQAGDKAAADALWEDIDMPLFAEEHLATAIAVVAGAPPAALPLVVAHHNLLPQATPRADIYTELFNGGAARTRLAGQARWVVYLHGHIHEDPVEIIDQRYPNSGKILSISAPLFSDGFNVITFEFGKLGRPLGCSILRFRYEKGGDVRSQPEIRVSLRSRTDAPNDLITSVLAVMTAGASYYFSDLLALVITAGQTVTEPELCDALREAEWAGALRIAQRDDEAAQWQIMRELF